MATFAISALVSPKKKFSMEHIQNATLAGGVAVGACADMMLTPGGALGVGAIAGLLSVCGFQ
jgi:ammonium transporter Rh